MLKSDKKSINYAFFQLSEQYNDKWRLKQIIPANLD